MNIFGRNDTHIHIIHLCDIDNLDRSFISKGLLRWPCAAYGAHIKDTGFETNATTTSLAARIPTNANRSALCGCQTNNKMLHTPPPHNIQSTKSYTQTEKRYVCIYA